MPDCPQRTGIGSGAVVCTCRVRSKVCIERIQSVADRGQMWRQRVDLCGLEQFICLKIDVFTINI